jgi:hypothetical protein
VPIAVPEAMPVFDVLNAMKKDNGPLLRKKSKLFTTGDEALDEVVWRYANFRKLMCEDAEDFDLQHAAGKVVVAASKKEAPKAQASKKKKTKRKAGDSDGESSDDESDDELDAIAFDDDEFDDNAPLFVQKQRVVEAKATVLKRTGGGAGGGTGRKKRVPGMKTAVATVEEEEEEEEGDDVPLVQMKRRKVV